MQHDIQFSLLVHQDMKERHEKETALRTERDVLAKDAADKQAADLVSVHVCFMFTTNILHATLAVRPLPAVDMVQLLSWPAPALSRCKLCNTLSACIFPA